MIRASNQIIQTYMIQICEFDQYIHRIVQHPNFVLRIGVLTDPKIRTDLLLGITAVNP